jgi:type II secretory pathway pseudopilin PulG
MSKFNIAAISALLALAAVLGTVAATHTVSLGAAKQNASAAAAASQSRRLDHFEASLRRALARRPPALPAIAKPASPPRVVYRRPAPVVVVRHLHHGDDEGESSAKGGSDD